MMRQNIPSLTATQSLFSLFALGHLPVDIVICMVHILFCSCGVCISRTIFFKDIFYSLIVCVHVGGLLVYGGVHMSAGTHGGLKRAMVSLELETVGAHLTWVLAKKVTLAPYKGSKRS